MFVRFFDEDAQPGVSDGAPPQAASVSTPAQASAPASPAAASASFTGEPTPAAAAPVEPAAPADEYGAVFELAKKAGYDLSGKYPNGQEALRGLIHAYGAVGKKGRFEDLGRQAAADWESYQEFKRTRQNPAGGYPAPPQQQANGLEMPKPLPNELREFIVKGDNGQPAIAEDAPPEAEAAIQKWFAQKRAWANRIVEDPGSVLGNWKQQIRDELMGEFGGLLSQREQAIQQQAAQEALLREVGPWLFELTPDGRPMVTVDDDGSVRKIHTPKGREYAEAMAYLTGNGMEPVRAHHAALRMIGGPPQASAPNAPASPAQVVTPGSTRTPSRAAAPPKNTQEMTLMEIIKAKGEDKFLGAA